jgi:hypothetical protein
MEKSLAEEFLDMGEEWQGAIEALLASNTPNYKPLAALFRRGGLIPIGAGEILGELLDPGRPEYLYFRLVLKSTRTPAQRAHLVKIKMTAALLYEKYISEVESADEAIEAVNKKVGLDKSGIFRYVAEWDKLRKRLHSKP